MKKAMMTLNVLLIAALLMIGCSSSEEPVAEQPQQPAPQAQSPAPVTTTPAAVSSPPTAAAPPATGPQPKLFVPVTKLDFGTQRGGKKIERMLTIKNTGKAELKIESVVPSCGCTAVDFPKSLSPGKSGRIKVAIEIGNSPGSHTKSVTIKSNDPIQPSLQVDLVFNVK